MKHAWSRFLLRWSVSSLGLWVAAAILGSENISVNNRLSVVIGSGFVLAVINTFVKPLVVFLSLPALLLSLGIFMIIINGLMVVLAAWLYKPLQVHSFGAAIIAGVVIGLVNLLMSAILEEKKS